MFYYVCERCPVHFSEVESEAAFEHGLNFALEGVQELVGGEGGERKGGQNASE